MMMMMVMEEDREKGCNTNKKEVLSILTTGTPVFLAAIIRVRNASIDVRLSTNVNRQTNGTDRGH
jgi:hypothetical protein